MALNFVAAEDGLEDGPELMQLARELKVTRAEAFWFVMRLRRLVVYSGNLRTGALNRSHTASKIAGFLEWSRSPARLISALKTASFLTFKKGRGFFYPGWKDTITGHYASRKENDRLWHERNRDERRQSADVRTTVERTSSDGLTTSARIPDQERKEGPDRPPEPPRPGGASERARARWEWLLKHAPSAQNRTACEAILGGLPDHEWALIQRAYNAGCKIGPPIPLSRKTLATLEWPTDRFLRQEAYFRFAPRTKSGKNGPPKPVDLAADLRARQEASDRYVTELLADPQASAEQKATAKKAWLASPVNSDRRPPWETPPSPPPVPSVN